MNKDLKMPFTNMKTSLCFQLAEFKQRQSKKAFVIGSLICMSTTAMTALAAPGNAYQMNAKSLIASAPSQSYSSNSSQDVNSLREQLLQKTKELQEYKSSLFRASHPQDQAKITELSQRIAEHEKAKQELLSKIQEYENELINAKKQMSTLEVSTDALTAFIQTQRAIVEAEKQELTAKIRAYEEDQQLENERKANEKLVAELESLKTTIATYESRITDLEHNHDKEIQDALQDAAMLKFELADARELAEKKEHEIIVSTLNYMTMALDHAKTLKSSHLAHKSKLNESQEDLSTLKAVIDEIANENLRLQRENDQLVEQSNAGETVLRKHFAERHVLASKLLEKEEALSAALLYYQGMLADQADQVQALQEQLSAEESSKHNLRQEKDHAISQHEVEKHVLEATTAENNKALIAHQATIDEHLNSIQSLQERLDKEVSERNRLQEEKDLLTTQINLHADVIAASHLEKEENTKALQASQTAIADHLAQIEDLKEKLNQEEEARRQLQQTHDELTTKHTNANQTLALHENDNQSLKQALQEKEESLKSALSSSQESLTDYEKQIGLLKIELAKQEAAQQELQQAHDELALNLTANKEALERALQEKEAHYVDTLTASQSSIAEHQKQIEELKEKLANEEAIRAQLQQAHDNLASTHSATEQKLSQYEVEKQSLEKNLQEKEEALNASLNSLETSTAEYKALIATLQDKLATEETSRLQLQQIHEGLSTNYADTEQKLAQYETAKQSLQRALQEKEEEHNSTLTSLQSSKAEYNSLIEALKERLANEETARRQLQESHDALSASNASVNEAFTLNQSEKDNLEATLKHKEEAFESSKRNLQQELSLLQERLAQQQAQQALNEAKHEEQLNEIRTLQQNIQEVTARQNESNHQNNDLQRELSGLNSQLEQKERESQAYNQQLHSLQMANEHLKESLEKALSDISTTKNQLTEIEQASAKKVEELENHHQNAAQEVSLLRRQINDDNLTIEHLRQEIAKVSAGYNDKTAKENELERAVQSLTVVAEHQDHALAEANSAFSMVQEYNYHLEAENKDLKNRLSKLETAERSVRRNADNSDEDNTQSFLSPAILNLLKPNSK